MSEKAVKLRFGESTLDLRLPTSLPTLEMRRLQPLGDPEKSVYQALADPIGCAPLEQIARGKRNACVVISDFTRPVPNKIILPPLLSVLQAAGLSKKNITILIATGMHRPNLGEELQALVGREIMERYPIVNHYCRKPEQYRKVDEIDGAPIEINQHYLDAELKILTGLIEPHFYAGYSGGGKAILPGISSFETMKFMHSYKMIDHSNVTNCVLQGNPFHEYVIRVTDLVGADFVLNVVINKDRQISGVFAGQYNHAHLAGCQMVYDHSVVPLDEPVDLVITSGGGYPLDATFYQVSKALICAKDILRSGGSILVACECREGLGSPEFCGIMHSVCSPQEFFNGYCDPKNLVIDQWCAQNIYQVLDHAGAVYICSPGLAPDDLKNTGIIRVENAQQTVERLVKRHPRAVAIPEGPYVVGAVKNAPNV
jgi:nickel-dependent lactate racemase